MLWVPIRKPKDKLIKIGGTKYEEVEEIGIQVYIKDIRIENKIEEELYYYFPHLLFISIIYKNKGQKLYRIKPHNCHMFKKKM